MWSLKDLLPKPLLETLRPSPASVPTPLPVGLTLEQARQLLNNPDAPDVQVQLGNCSILLSRFK